MLRYWIEWSLRLSASVVLHSPSSYSKGPRRGQRASGHVDLAYRKASHCYFSKSEDHWALALSHSDVEAAMQPTDAGVQCVVYIKGYCCCCLTTSSPLSSLWSLSLPLSLFVDVDCCCGQSLSKQG